MLTINDKIAPTWFPVQSDDPPPAEFLLAPLSPVAFLDVRNECEFSEGGSFTISGRGVICAVRDSVRDWRNVANAKHEQLPFNRRTLDDLPWDVLLNLAVEIVKRSVLSEIERKNLYSPSTSG